MDLLFFVFVFTTIIFLVRWYRTVVRGVSLPPGPKRLPIIGNVFDLPEGFPWLTYTHWAADFGEVVYFEVFGAQTIILNSVKAVTELLDKRSSNYAGRPRMVMANELAEWEWDFAHMSHTESWRRHRKTFHQYFNSRTAQAHQSIQMEATIVLLQRLLSSPDDYASHIRHHSGSIILRLSYGYTAQSENDQYVALAREAIKGLSQAINGRLYLVEYLPILKYAPVWFPGARFKRDAREWAKFAKALKVKPFEALQKTIAEGTAIPSFVSESLDKVNNAGSVDQEQEEIIKNCAGVAYLAGSDTTVSLVSTFLLAMVSNPLVQARAQAEIDAVVGRSRLPNFDDKPSLPYLEAIVYEALRWRPITPLALPHRAKNDDIYEGYLIPAGATVIGNAWGILHDENIYPEPHNFIPERFLKTPGKTLPPNPVDVGAFGFGRRICPGRYLALNTAWIATAAILALFDIKQPLDSNGKEYIPSVEYTSGLVSHPTPFPLRFIPRSRNSIQLIRSSEE